MTKLSRSAIAALVVLLLLLTTIVGSATALMMVRTGVYVSTQITSGSTSQSYTPGVTGYGFSYWHGNSPRSGYCNGVWPGTVSTSVTVYPGSVLVHNPPPPAPSAPSAITVGQVVMNCPAGVKDGFSGTASWTDSAYATSYNMIVYYTTKTGTAATKTYSGLTSNSSSFVVASSAVNPDVTISVQAVGASGTSGWSNGTPTGYLGCI